MIWPFVFLFITSRNLTINLHRLDRNLGHKATTQCPYPQSCNRRLKIRYGMYTLVKMVPPSLPVQFVGLNIVFHMPAFEILTTLGEDLCSCKGEQLFKQRLEIEQMV